MNASLIEKASGQSAQTKNPPFRSNEPSTNWYLPSLYMDFGCFQWLTIEPLTI
jgi:hypothetical protein